MARKLSGSQMTHAAGACDRPTHVRIALDMNTCKICSRAANNAWPQDCGVRGGSNCHHLTAKARKQLHHGRNRTLPRCSLINNCNADLWALAKKFSFVLLLAQFDPERKLDLNLTTKLYIWSVGYETTLHFFFQEINHTLGSRAHC